MKHKTPKFSSIEKALEVLMAFTRSDHEMGTVELGQELGLHFSTVSRILQTLKQKGFLQHNEKTRKFSLGPSTFELGRSIFRFLSGDILQIAMPYLTDLRHEVGETVVLEMLSGNDLIVMYKAEGKRSFSVGPNVGDKVPPNISPGAKVIMAFSDDDTINGLLDREMRQNTPNTITDKKTIKGLFPGIRKQGFAVSKEEMSIGINAIGAPIFDHHNKPFAAIVITGLSSRIPVSPVDQRITEALKKTTQDISAQLFHRQSIDQINGEKTLRQ